MTILENASLLKLNTFGIETSTNYLVNYHSVAELQAFIKTDLFLNNKFLHIGGGSNLLFMNDFQGVILHSEIQFITVRNENSEHVFIEVGAGVQWDDFVAYAVKNNWYGIENLSLIPGEVGASAIQNIGAYGVEVCDTITKVNALNLQTGKLHVFDNADCKYSYRESVFKKELKNQYAITSVLFKLQKSPNFKLDYQHLEDEVLKNGEISIGNVRSTIIAVRESKLPDPHVTGNAGSFFMNPVIERSVFTKLQAQYSNMPHYFVSDEKEKVPAAWLIDQCGWKGKSVGNAGVHPKQALVLVNNGGATGAEIAHLSALIEQSVFEKFGIKLTPEVIFIS